jgi:hypothetical protein
MHSVSTIRFTFDCPTFAMPHSTLFQDRHIGLLCIEGLGLCCTITNLKVVARRGEGCGVSLSVVWVCPHLASARLSGYTEHFTF